MAENLVKNDKMRIIKCVNDNFVDLTNFLATSRKDYPHCCTMACNYIEDSVKKGTGINLERHMGTIYLSERKAKWNFHYWLGYKGLIIDPTDYQFSAFYMREAFSKLKQELISGTIDPHYYVEELKRSFGCNIFYKGKYEKDKNNGNDIVIKSDRVFFVKIPEIRPV